MPKAKRHSAVCRRSGDAHLRRLLHDERDGLPHLLRRGRVRTPAGLRPASARLGWILLPGGCPPVTRWPQVVF